MSSRIEVSMWGTTRVYVHDDVHNGKRLVARDPRLDQEISVVLLNNEGVPELIEALGGFPMITEDAIVVYPHQLPEVTSDPAGNVHVDDRVFGSRDADNHRATALRHLAIAKFLEEEERAQELQQLTLEAKALYGAYNATHRRPYQIWDEMDSEEQSRWHSVARAARKAQEVGDDG